MNKNEAITTSHSPMVKWGIDLTSAGAAVTAYHPLRTVAVQMIASKPIEWKGRALYRGFGWSSMAAHQLFVMGAAYRSLKEKYRRWNRDPSAAERMAMGAVAGVVSTPTTTICDMMTVQRQLGRAVPNYHFRTLFRGLIPMGMRQSGLGAGMFAFPEIVKERYGSKTNEKMTSFAASFAGGCITSVGTQVAEVARTLMHADIQREKYPTARKAFQDAIVKETFSSKGMKLMGIRLAVLVTAAVVVNLTKEGLSQMTSRRTPNG
jgi:hypothetical protein